MQLKGKRILITGANSGIGSSILELILKNQGALIALYHKNRNHIDQILSKNEVPQSSIQVIDVDLLDDNSINSGLSKIKQIETIDVFIHCVSLPLKMKNFSQLIWSDFQNHIDLQTKSFIQILQTLLPHMKQHKKGKIITILTSGVVGNPPNLMSDYIVAKYSLLGLCKSLAIELGSYGITVNSISPSLTNTPLTEKFPSKLKEILIQQIPMKRLNEPKDVASVALFLCSEYSNYISGENILVSGGSVLH